MNKSDDGDLSNDDCEMNNSSCSNKDEDKLKIDIIIKVVYYSSSFTVL